MIYVYAITEGSTTSAPALPGLEDTPLELRAWDDIGAVISRHDRGSIAPTADNLWRHEHVIETLMREQTLLPGRFGTVFAVESDLDHVLERNRRRLKTGLAKVRNCVELGVRVLWQAQTDVLGGAELSAAAESGRQYMLRRAAQERRQHLLCKHTESRAETIHGPLAALASDSTRRQPEAIELPLCAAYLVRRERTRHFKSCVNQLAAEHPDLRILCTGPWPPYHFVPQLEPAEVCHA